MEMTLQELFETPRMGHAPLDAINSVQGLFDLVKRHFEPHFKMVEIGSFEGVSTMLFSRFADTVYAVDCYDYTVPPTGRIPSHDQLFIDAEKTFIERTKNIKNIVKVRKTSLEAAKDFPDRSLDAVYIDGEHDELNVRQDIETWRPKVKFGGFLMGHDFYLPYVKPILNGQGFGYIDIAPDLSWAVKIPTVRIVAVACTKVPETIDAMQRCMKLMEFNGAALFTHEDVQADGIEIVKIPQLDYKGYNEFVAMRLGDFVDTDYFLLVQNDGYITDVTQWDDRFLTYDYIGAPWPPKTHYSAGKEIRVGNGGFSLRSRRLMRAPRKLGLTFSDMGTGFWHEDGFLCVHNRQLMEDYGIKFAPVDIAAKFSTELKVPETTQSFGKHKYL